ncbi:MAG: anthranilate synthase component I family protein [Planctomycetota bacterium]
MQAGQTLDSSLTPIDVLRRWPADQPIALLHSGRPHPRWSRYSILAQPDGAIRFDGQTFQQTGQPDRPCDDPFATLQSALDQEPQALYLGYLGYDLGRWVEDIPATARDDRPWPILQFERCPGWLVYDNLSPSWTGHGTWANNHPLTELPPTDPDRPSTFHAEPARPEQTRTQFEASIQRVKDYIAAGDVFQANLAQRFTGRFTGQPRALFASLAHQSPAWYGAYLELSPQYPGEPRRTIASTSPELFLQCDPTGHITTRPIKGTLPADQPADRLAASEKDAAELAMIVDLLRNDLGRVCRVGSIRIDQPRAIETHPTIHHGVATLNAQLAPGRRLIDLLRATLPGGSITGAPKVRSMQIIEELEPNRRGPYCGAIGMIHGQAMTLNIAIRTLLLEQPNNRADGRYQFSVGAGIVADSTPAAEYDETLSKARAILNALASPKAHQTITQQQAQQ